MLAATDQWLDPSGYTLGNLNPNEALDCVDDMNRVVLQARPHLPCYAVLYAGWVRAAALRF